MNRKKKINEALKKRKKQTNSKLHRSNKPRYISKAERAKMEAETAQNQDNVTSVEPQQATANDQPESTGE